MKFWFDGSEWDTDKPIYVAGYKIIKTWFPIKKNNDLTKIKKEKYELKYKKGYISKIVMEYNNGQSFVEDIYVFIPNYTLSGILNAKSIFIDTGIKKLKDRLQLK